jgi:L-ascorbate 6-phosphate lactonase
VQYYKKSDAVRQNKKGIGLRWLGQAGFLLTDLEGETIGIDLYLSDLAERKDGNKRLTPSVVSSKELNLVGLLATHEHTDHLDLDSLSDLLQPDVPLICNSQSYVLCKKLGFPMDNIHSLEKGESIQVRDFFIQAVYAHHGDLSPTAIGFLISVCGLLFYFTGDTSFESKQMEYAIGQSIDVLILPINGEFGNMNERDAARFAFAVQPNLTIPCHFWTFARHRGNPYDFELAMKQVAPCCQTYVMSQGEEIIIAI